MVNADSPTTPVEISANMSQEAAELESVDAFLRSEGQPEPKKKRIRARPTPEWQRELYVVLFEARYKQFASNFDRTPITGMTRAQIEENAWEVFEKDRRGLSKADIAALNFCPYYKYANWKTWKDTTEPGKCHPCNNPECLTCAVRELTNRWDLWGRLAYSNTRRRKCMSRIVLEISSNDLLRPIADNLVQQLRRKLGINAEGYTSVSLPAAGKRRLTMLITHDEPLVRIGGKTGKSVIDSLVDRPVDPQQIAKWFGEFYVRLRYSRRKKHFADPILDMRGKSMRRRPKKEIPRQVIPTAVRSELSEAEALV